MKHDVLIDLRKLDKIVSGELQAETKEELVFVHFYNCGRVGELLALGCTTLVETIDDLTFNEIYHLIMGYCMGQKDLLDEMEFEQQTEWDGETH